MCSLIDFHIANRCVDSKFQDEEIALPEPAGPAFCPWLWSPAQGHCPTSYNHKLILPVVEFMCRSGEGFKNMYIHCQYRGVWRFNMQIPIFRFFCNGLDGPRSLFLRHSCGFHSLPCSVLLSYLASFTALIPGRIGSSKSGMHSSQSDFSIQFITGMLGKFCYYRFDFSFWVFLGILGEAAERSAWRDAI